MLEAQDTVVLVVFKIQILNLAANFWSYRNICLQFCIALAKPVLNITKSISVDVHCFHKVFHRTQFDVQWR